MIARVCIALACLTVPAQACRTVNEALGEEYEFYHSFSRPLLGLHDRNLILKSTHYRLGELTVEVNKVDAESLSEWRNKDFPQFTKGLNKWRAKIAENVEFAISQYPRRHWPESFFEELRNVAQAEWASSTFITVRDRSGQIVGTLRLISSRYEEIKSLHPSAITQGVGGVWALDIFSKAVRDRHWGDAWKTVPLERGLGVNLARPFWSSGKLRSFPDSLGEAIEPGNFAVDPKASPEVYRLLMHELVREVFDPANSADYNMNGKVLYTYADARGKRLYVPSGFEVVDEKDPIVHEGISWWVLRMTPRSFKKKVDALVSRPKWTESDIEEFRELMNAFARPHELAADVIEEADGQHGLVSPRGYSVEERVKAELEDLKRNLSRHLRDTLPNSVSTELMAPYDELLISLNVAVSTNAYPIDQHLYWDMVVFRNYSNPMRVGGFQEMPPPPVFSMDGTGPTHVVQEMLLVKPENYPKGAYKSEDYLIKAYGPFWEAKKILHTLLLRDDAPYYRTVDDFNADLVSAIAEELQDRPESLSSKEMNTRLLEKFWQRYRARGGR